MKYTAAAGPSGGGLDRVATAIQPGDASKSAMTVTIRAHFDGNVIVPDEAVSLPRDTPLMVRVETAKANAAVPHDGRSEALDPFLARARARPVPCLPDDSLRRESIYED